MDHNCAGKEKETKKNLSWYALTSSCEKRRSRFFVLSLQIPSQLGPYLNSQQTKLALFHHQLSIMDYFLGFQESKLKSHLKMAVHRIALQVNKKTAAQKHAKREIATLLAEMKDEKARIKVEHVIREDFTIEALGLLELLCELTHERSKYIASEKTCPPDLKEAIASLIWASNRVDVAELDEVKKQFTLKYGKEFSEESINNAANTVNVRLFQKLSVTPPSAFLVIRYLEEIAREFEVEWISTDLGLPKTTNTQPPSQPSQSQTQMGSTSMISHDGRVMGSSSSKVAPMPVGGYDGASSSGAGADMYLPMSSPGGYTITTTLHQPSAFITVVSVHHYNYTYTITATLHQPSAFITVVSVHHYNYTYTITTTLHQPSAFILALTSFELN